MDISSVRFKIIISIKIAVLIANKDTLDQFILIL